MGSARIPVWLLPAGFALAIATLWVALDRDDALSFLMLEVAGALVGGAALSWGWRRRWWLSREIAPRDARAHPPVPFKRLVRRVPARKALHDLLDRLPFRIDTVPKRLYQAGRVL